jgi:hypothetical protein
MSTCLLCNQEQSASPFCLIHQKDWTVSPERQGVDFSTEESYVESVFKFVERYEKENVYIQPESA